MLSIRLCFCVLIASIHQCFQAQAASCTACVDPASPSHSFKVKTYHDSQEFLENPHRGFVEQMVTRSSNPGQITLHRLDQKRRATGITMIWRTIVLDTFRTSLISDDFLAKIRQDLDAIEAASFTVVLRFAYNFEARDEHPWGDASKNQVLQHVAQLAPIFVQYERVITSIQAGFIGFWGEWHHSEYFGTTSYGHQGIEPMTGLYPRDLANRKEVFLALLNAAPKSIQVQLRYPRHEMYFMDSVPATFADVKSGNNRGRTGSHNDCFISNDNDVGTYHNKTIEYPYLERDTKYTIMGGETCRLTTNHRHECPTAQKEMAMFHWTFLNQGYTKDIYNVWKQQGCYLDVHRNLGYRLAIKKAIIPQRAHTGDKLCFHMEFINNGYAAPVKPFGFNLVFQSTDSSGHYFAASIPGVDVRDWQPGYTQTVSSAVMLTNVPHGKYKVLVTLSDHLMGDRADYNVLLATQGVPLYTLGLNDLGIMIAISGTRDAAPSPCPAMTAWQPPAPSRYSRSFNGTMLLN